jgi:branched-chain amino acid transport system ATP-binding protein
MTQHSQAQSKDVMAGRSESLLSVERLSVAYGGIQAVRTISFQVPPNSLVALIGANGAGKTSILRAICGLTNKSSGELRYEGQSITEVAASELPARGLILVPEGRGVFRRMTVLENLKLGAYCREGFGTGGLTKSEIQRDLEEQLDGFPRLRERLGQLAGTLSGGEQQMLAIARALMGRPRLLLLDEPSMGLSPILVDQVFEKIQSIARAGTTILLVEQNARMALEIASQGLVLESGQLTLQGSGKDLLKSAEVRAAYLGEE